MQKLFAKKDSGGKEIIVECGLAVVAVALLILFRREIGKLVQNLMANATTKIDNMFDGGNFS